MSWNLEFWKYTFQKYAELQERRDIEMKEIAFFLVVEGLSTRKIKKINVGPNL